VVSGVAAVGWCEVALVFAVAATGEPVVWMASVLVFSNRQG
jgi:hypothetical protein